MRDATVRFLAILPLLLAFGCSSTQSTRITFNKKLFATYPPDVQAAIRSGQIQQGFDQKQVWLALGLPREPLTGGVWPWEAQGASETWLYTEVVKKVVIRMKTADEYQRQVANSWKDPEPSRYWREVFERTRVVRVVKFTDGRVTSWADPPSQYLDDWIYDPSDLRSGEFWPDR